MFRFFYNAENVYAVIYLTLVHGIVEHFRTPLIRRADFFVTNVHDAVQPFVRRLNSSY